MSKEIVTQIQIDAPSHQVWQTLTDFHAYQNWNPFMVDVKGAAQLHENVTISVAFKHSQRMQFKIKICEFESAKSLCWTSKFLIGGLFDSVHRFDISSISSNQCLFLNQEAYSGILVGLSWKKIEPGARAGFEAMNRALKHQVESQQLARAS